MKPAELKTASTGNQTALSLVTRQKKIPAGTKKAMIQDTIMAREEMNGGGISRKEKAEITQEITEMLLESAPVDISGVLVLYGQSPLVFVENVSDKVLDTVPMFWRDITGEIIVPCSAGVVERELGNDWSNPRGFGTAFLHWLYEMSKTNTPTVALAGQVTLQQEDRDEQSKVVQFKKGFPPTESLEQLMNEDGYNISALDLYLSPRDDSSVTYELTLDDNMRVAKFKPHHDAKKGTADYHDEVWASLEGAWAVIQELKQVFIEG